jgi:broad specificity phosphatase PhoE
MNRPPALILLVRHAHTEAIGRYLAGRTPGISLNACGREEADHLPARLARQPVETIYCSPLERAISTAMPLARARPLTIRVEPDLHEVDFGEWTGLTFPALERLPAWQHFNAHRATAPVPGGETAVVAQARILRALDRIRAAHGGETVIVVSHADMIRYALLHAAGRSLDDVHTLTITPASVTPLPDSIGST